MFKNLIIIIGMPRSGTSWLSQILDSSAEIRFKLSPIFSYAFKNAVNESSSKEEFIKLFNDAYNTDDDFMDQKQRRTNGEYPDHFNKSKNPDCLVVKMTRFHNLIERMVQLIDNLKIVSIIRHPCGAIHSWLTTPGEFPANADPLKEWRKGECRKTAPEEFWGFDDWKTTTQLYLKLKTKYPEKFYLLRYENLVDDVLNESKKLFQFLELKFSKQTENFLVNSQSCHHNGSYAVFKSPEVKTRWKKELQYEIRTEIENELQFTEMEEFLK